MKVIIGAGDTEFEGWMSTDIEELDLINKIKFEKLFPQKNVEVFLAEHVWEHLSLEEGILAAKNCYNHLMPGGYIRIAVPDKNFNNAWYQNMVKIGGPGPKDHPAYSHKILYDYKMLTKVFEKAGFKVCLLEYSDEDGNFHYKYWNPADGYIGRSYRFDTRNNKNKLIMTSIIIDAFKELIIS